MDNTLFNLVSVDSLRVLYLIVGLDMMKVTVDPCHDFYEYTCGRKQSQDDLNSSHPFDVKPSELKRRVLTTEKPMSEAEEKASMFFQSCVKAAKEPQTLNSNKDLEKLFTTLEKMQSLQEKLKFLHNEFGLSPFFSWSVAIDMKNSEENIIQIYQTPHTILETGDPEQIDEFTEEFQNSTKIKSMMSEILGQRLNFSDSEEIKQILKLESEIRQILQPPLHQESTEYLNRYHKLSLTQLQKVANFINWKDFFNNGLAKTGHLRKIRDDEEIALWCFDYLSKLTKKLENLLNVKENQKLLDKLLIWEVGKEILSEILIAANEPHETGKYCALKTEQYFEFALTSMFRRSILQQNPDPQFESKSIKLAQKMVENIQSELIFILKTSKWQDENSRLAAVEKARKTKVTLGFPDFVKDPKLLDDFYSEMNFMDELDYIGNVIKGAKFKMAEKWRRYSRGFVDKTEWPGYPISPLMDNAWIYWERNHIFISLMSLLPPNFHPDFPPSRNYAGLGITLAHEFAHGFSGFGPMFDKNGKFDSIWKTQEAIHEFENRTNCFIEQYSKFQFPDAQFLDGVHTSEENMADNGGLILAFRGLNRHLFKDFGDDAESLYIFPDGKNLQLTDKQLFFVSFAQRWCEHVDELEKTKDPHSPNKFRVLGTLRNSQDFSRAFDCPDDLKLNLKCSVF